MLLHTTHLEQPAFNTGVSSAAHRSAFTLSLLYPDSVPACLARVQWVDEHGVRWELRLLKSLSSDLEREEEGKMNQVGGGGGRLRVWGSWEW